MTEQHSVHGWRPIETAPKDGSHILATGWDFGVIGNDRHVSIVAWRQECEEWREDGDNEQACAYLTHWMPLPPLPVSLDTGGSQKEGSTHNESSSGTERSETETAVVIRRNADDTVDEICAAGCSVHIEQMDGNSFYIGITAKDRSYHQFWLGARNRKSLVDVRHTESSPAVAETHPRDSSESTPPAILSDPTIHRAEDR